MESDPLTVSPDYLLADIAEQIKEVHYGAAVAVDGDERPVGLVTRADLVSPPRRRVILVDHAEQAQSAIGIGEAEILEILDHHHIGSIETRVPVTATFDPVGSTATLVVERFRQAGMEPSAVDRDDAARRGPVGHGDPQLADDHRARPRRRRVPRAGAERSTPRELGREMFEATADVSDLDAEEIVTRDAKRYQVRGDQEICIAQVEVVGEALRERREELLSELHRAAREQAPGALRADDHRRDREGHDDAGRRRRRTVARSFGVERD